MNASNPAGKTPEPLVLVIEDEMPIRRFLRASLPRSGYRLIEAGSGTEGLYLGAQRLPDLVLLDLGLPDIEGLEVTKRLREWTNVPIIILSARDQETEKVAALDAGADDYLTKPFGTAELMARMRVALRHAAAVRGETGPIVTVGPLKIDLAGRLVWLKGQEVHLTDHEFRLLSALARHADKVLTHRQLLQEVWGPDFVEHSHYLRVYMGHLRHKLEPDPAQPRLILTEPGVGYRLRVD